MRACSDAKHYGRMTHSFVGVLILRRHQSEELPRQPRQPRQPTTATRHAMPRPTAAGETMLRQNSDDTELMELGDMCVCLMSHTRHAAPLIPAKTPELADIPSVIGLPTPYSMAIFPLFPPSFTRPSPSHPGRKCHTSQQVEKPRSSRTRNPN